MVSRIQNQGLSLEQSKISTKKNKTTITPFEKVLEETQKAEKTMSAEPIASSVTPLSSGSEKLDSIFKRASEKYDVPYNFLIAVAKAESDFDVNATSKSGAQGIMQLMPSTAKSLGVKDAYDPEQNIMGAAKYLASHLKTFDGNTDLAAAAYNAGGQAVKKYGGIPPYTETQNYVKTINKYMKDGVTVPDKTVKTTSNKVSTDVDNAVAATEEEMKESLVVIGTGEEATTMTYGAYLKYLELGGAGVG